MGRLKGVGDKRQSKSRCQKALGEQEKSKAELERKPRERGKLMYRLVHAEMQAKGKLRLKQGWEAEEELRLSRGERTKGGGRQRKS